MATLPVRSACVQVRPKTRGVTRLEGDNPGEFLNKVTICNTVPRSDIGLDIGGELQPTTLFRVRQR